MRLAPYLVGELLDALAMQPFDRDFLVPLLNCDRRPRPTAGTAQWLDGGPGARLVLARRRVRAYRLGRRAGDLACRRRPRA